MKRLILLVSLSAPIGTTAALAQLHPYNPHGAYTFDQVITGSLNATGGTLSGVAVDNATVNGVPLKMAISSAAGLTPAQASTLANALTSAAIGQTVAGLTNNVVPPINMPAFTGDITSNAGSTATSLAATGVSAGVCLKPTVDAKGRATGCAALAPTDLPSSTQAAIGQAQTALQPDSGGHLPATAAPALTGDVTSSAGSTVTSLASTGVPAGTCLKPTVDAKGRATGCAALVPTDLPSSTQAAIGQAQTALQPDSSGHLPATAAPALTGDVTSSAGSTVTSLASTGVPAGTCLKPTVDAKGRATGCSALAASDMPLNIPAADLTNAPGGPAATATTPGTVPNLGGASGAALLNAFGALDANIASSGYSSVPVPVSQRFAADGFHVYDRVMANGKPLVCDSRRLSDITVTANSNLIKSASYTFVQGDVGKMLNLVVLHGLGGATTSATGGVNNNLVLAQKATITAISGGQAQISVTPTVSAANNGSTIMTFGTDATAAFNQTMADAETVSSSDIIMPMGNCAISAPVALTLSGSQSARLRGAGVSATHLIQYSDADAVDVTTNAGTNLIVDDFQVSHADGALPSSEYVHDNGVWINESTPGSAGLLYVENIATSTSVPAYGSDGFAVGVHGSGTSAGFFANLNITQPTAGFTDAGAAANYANPVNQLGLTIPSAVAAGVNDGLLLDPGPNGFTVDTIVEGISVQGGIAGVDVTQGQGFYANHLKIVYGDVAVRALCPGGACEAFHVTNTLTNDNVAGVQILGYWSDVALTTNTFWSNLGSRPYTGVYEFDTSNTVTSGNTLLGSAYNGGAVGSVGGGSWGIFFDGNNAQGGYPVAITGNAIFRVPYGMGIGNAPGYNLISVTGNTMTNVLMPYGDLTGYMFGSSSTPGTDYFPNQVAGATAVGIDYNGNIQFPNSLMIGQYYQAGQLYISGPPQTNSYSWEGNVSAYVPGTSVAYYLGIDGLISGGTVINGTAAAAGATSIVVANGLGLHGLQYIGDTTTPGAFPSTEQIKSVSFTSGTSGPATVQLTDPLNAATGTADTITIAPGGSGYGLVGTGLNPPPNQTVAVAGAASGTTMTIAGWPFKGIIPTTPIADLTNPSAIPTGAKVGSLTQAGVLTISGGTFGSTPPAVGDVIEFGGMLQQGIDPFSKLSMNQGTLFGNLSCDDTGSNRFNVDLTAMYSGYALKGSSVSVRYSSNSSTTNGITTYGLPTGTTIAAGRRADDGEPSISVTTSIGYFCKGNIHVYQ